MHCGEGLLKLTQLVPPGSCVLLQTSSVLGVNAKQHKKWLLCLKQRALIISPPRQGQGPCRGQMVVTVLILGWGSPYPCSIISIKLCDVALHGHAAECN